MKLVAILAGAALALVPTGTALAGETGNGQAYGNCRNSSQGGIHEPLSPEVGKGKGNGGLQGVSAADCKADPEVKPTPSPTQPANPGGGGGGGGGGSMDL